MAITDGVAENAWTGPDLWAGLRQVRVVFRELTNSYRQVARVDAGARPGRMLDVWRTKKRGRSCFGEQAMGPAQLEKRIAALEEELARLKSKVERFDALQPWWERIAGTFQDDPVYEKAMELGRQHRRSLGRGPGKRKRER